MPDWKRIIVGDAFTLPSRDINYYRDLVLMWPFLLFAIAGVASLLGAGHDYRTGAKALAASLVILALARERLALILGALGFCAVQGLLAYGLKHDWMGLAVAIPAGALVVLLVFIVKDWETSYRLPRGLTIADTLISLTSLGFGILLIRWFGR